MVNIFIFHGVEGYPEENWFPWLKKELESLGLKVIVPQFPTPENQTLENWMEVLIKYKEDISKDTILIGHSLGVPFLLNVLERYDISAAFLVSGFVGKAGNEFDESMKTFAQKEFNWRKIKENCRKFVIFHSDNDPYIALNKAMELRNKLDGELRIIKGGGHFNTDAGFSEFPQLLEKIKESIQNQMER